VSQPNPWTLGTEELIAIRRANPTGGKIWRPISLRWRLVCESFYKEKIYV